MVAKKSESVRDTLIAEIKKIVGRGVHVVGYQDATDVLSVKTIIVKQQTISRLAEAPAGQLRIDYTLTFVSPATDPEKAEYDLDKWVPETLADFTMSWFSWTGATKVVFNEQNLGYDVSAFVLTTIGNDKKE
jgi:hypothetical protein